VQGEVYEISPQLERVLDEIEELYPQQTNEYAKRDISVQTSQGARWRASFMKSTLRWWPANR
jgi:gamma-glutamylcyclotransferase (GGCT)/AIG2-like uncharacterized protein YtfP